MTRRSPPLVTILLVLAILAVYGLELAGDGMAICYRLGFVAARPTLASALSALFLHDPGNAWHVGGNVVALGLFGALVERELGSLRFLALYLLGGLAGAALHLVVDPSSTVPLVGCSGAIFGLLAMAAVLRPPLLGFVVAFAAINVVEALTGTGGAVAVGAHLGGLSAGVIFAAVMRLRGALALEPV